MIAQIMETEEAFLENCECAFKVFGFVEMMESDTKWCLDVAYYNQSDNSFSILFKSYLAQEHKDYILSIRAIKNNDKWELTVIQKIDNLVR